MGPLQAWVPRLARTNLPIKALLAEFVGLDGFALDNAREATGFKLPGPTVATLALWQARTQCSSKERIVNKFLQVSY